MLHFIFENANWLERAGLYALSWGTKASCQYLRLYPLQGHPHPSVQRPLQLGRAGNLSKRGTRFCPAQAIEPRGVFSVSFKETAGNFTLFHKNTSFHACPGLCDVTLDGLFFSILFFTAQVVDHRYLWHPVQPPHADTLNFAIPQQAVGHALTDSQHFLDLSECQGVRVAAEIGAPYGSGCHHNRSGPQRGRMLPNRRSAEAEPLGGPGRYHLLSVPGGPVSVGGGVPCQCGTIKSSHQFKGEYCLKISSVGIPAKDIAKAMGYSVWNVTKHRKAALEKIRLLVTGRTEIGD